MFSKLSIQIKHIVYIYIYIYLNVLINTGRIDVRLIKLNVRQKYELNTLSAVCRDDGRFDDNLGYARATYKRRSRILRIFVPGTRKTQ